MKKIKTETNKYCKKIFFMIKFKIMEKRGKKMEKAKVKKENSKKQNKELSKEIEKKFNVIKEISKEEEPEIDNIEEIADPNETKFKQIKTKNKEIKKMKEANKKKKWIPATIITSSIIVIALIFSTIFALLNMNKDTIVKGVKIEGIDISNLSSDEAKNKIETIYKEKTEKEIPIKYEDYETTINPTIIETKYETEEAIKEAKSIGRKGNIFQNNYEIIQAMLGKKDIDIKMQINEEVAKKTIEDIGTNLPGIVVESGYYIEDNKLIITKGQSGIKIDTDQLLERLKRELDTPKTTEEPIKIPVTQKEPEPIDIDKIHTEVYKEVKDAYYTKDPFTIYPEVQGVDFDVEAAKKMLEEDKEQYIIDLIITEPKITTNQIGTEAFPDQLGTFKTTYDGGDTDRTTNLQLACQKINGKVILAGETFSYNQTLGPRSAATGYKNAKVYSAGQVVDGIGGGICQISSTLYNAVLRANLQIVERKNHQFVTSYVEAGMDATVVYGSTDFKFKNTRKYPVKIVASAKNGIATVSLYGIKEEKEYTFSFRTVTVSTIPTSTRYIEDPTLPVGTEKVKQKGANGRKTETYMTKMLDGKVVSTTLLSRDTYDAMQKIILKGTKGQTKSNTQTQTNPQPVQTQEPVQQTQEPSQETQTPEQPTTEEQTQ